MDNQLSPANFAQLMDVLAHWNIAPVTAITPIQSSRAVFKIATTGLTYTLKNISQAANLVRLTFTRNVLLHVAEAGLRVPIPLLAQSAQPFVRVAGDYYQLYEFIESGEAPSDAERIATLIYHTGQAIATLHVALTTYDDPDVAGKTWREDFPVRVPEWIADLSRQLPELQANIVKRVGRERGQGLVDAFRALPEQLIHRDCHPGNILTQGTQVNGFIDCDHFCIGPRLFDVAYYAVHHLKWVTEDEAATQRWLTQLPSLIAGYCSRQTLTQREVLALPAGMMIYHLLLAHWFMNSGLSDPIALELRSLAWIHQHYDAIVAAIV